MMRSGYLRLIILGPGEKGGGCSRMASLRKEGVDALGEEGLDMIPKPREIDTSAPNFSQHSLFEHTYPWVGCCCCCEFRVFSAVPGSHVEVDGGIGGGPCSEDQSMPTE